jgi:23S rRNA (adenine2503-C2)-methyltransferase
MKPIYFRKNMITKNIKVPTGNILIVEGEKGLIECLSIGDYGKQANIKADFLGLHDEINGVPNGKVMPLTEKWVITISTQYGCSMNCRFCDVPKVGKGRNATLKDLHRQVDEALKLHPEITHTKRLNIHYARMGEPTFNPDVITHAKEVKDAVKKHIGDSLVHPVVSTMLPKGNRNLFGFLYEWCDIKNRLYKGDAGLQLSINSTDDKQRDFLFSGNTLTLREIAKIGYDLPLPAGRKYALNFAVSDKSIINADILRFHFDPEKFMIKITPIHETATSRRNEITTSGGYEKYYPYKEIEESLKDAGFDVLVFIPSKEEDESRITCGNAILAGHE